MIQRGHLQFPHLTWPFRYSSIFISTTYGSLVVVSSNIPIFQEPVASPISIETVAADKTDNPSVDIVLSPQRKVEFQSASPVVQ